MAKRSAGLLMYRTSSGRLEVLLVHPGGPFWARKDIGAWSIPKGEYEAGDDALQAARREFLEETGTTAAGPFLPLAAVRQASGKIVTAWACEGEFDPATLVSNEFELEWPARSGRMQRFPEVDRAGWFPLDEARRRILKGQLALLDELEEKLSSR
jgi:predicted NUDIX family NTP pyrophosphohydrolase